jgi:hypothetical protein
MLVTRGGIVISASAVHPLNVPFAMLVRPLLSVTESNHMQFWKANRPRLVTLFGIVTDSSHVQSAKAYSPMLVTLPGIVTDSSQKQP